LRRAAVQTSANIAVEIAVGTGGNNTLACLDLLDYIVDQIVIAIVSGNLRPDAQKRYWRWTMQ
jgi:hypothetical protein